MRGCLWVAGEVQHELHHRDQLDGRARLQAEEPGGAGGGQSQGGLGEACGEYSRLVSHKYGHSDDLPDANCILLKGL